jgi:hypothetical protein
MCILPASADNTCESQSDARSRGHWAHNSLLPRYKKQVSTILKLLPKGDESVITLGVKNSPPGFCALPFCDCITCCSMPALSNRWNNSDIHRMIVVILLLGDSSFDADTLQALNK